MRQVNIAQRCVNAVAVVRDCAVVAVINASLLLRHLHTRTLGTTSKSIGLERPEFYSWGSGWLRKSGMQLQPVQQPVPSPTPRNRSR